MIENELLVIVYSVHFFRSYLYIENSFVTDHEPLKWLHSVKDPTSRLLQLRLKLSEYEYEIVYKAGKINANADALSRNPIPVLPINTAEKSDSDESLFSAKKYSKKRGD